MEECNVLDETGQVWNGAYPLYGKFSFGIFCLGFNHEKKLLTA
jgi:hypothetical protein